MQPGPAVALTHSKTAQKDIEKGDLYQIKERVDFPSQTGAMTTKQISRFNHRLTALTAADLAFQK